SISERFGLPGSHLLGRCLGEPKIGAPCLACSSWGRSETAAEGTPCDRGESVTSVTLTVMVDSASVTGQNTSDEAPETAYGEDVDHPWARPPKGFEAWGT